MKTMWGEGGINKMDGDALSTVITNCFSVHSGPDWMYHRFAVVAYYSRKCDIILLLQV